MVVNQPAVKFWSQAVQEYTGGDFQRREINKDEYTWIVFQFSSLSGSHDGAL
jgi:hypothetical protein